MKKTFFAGLLATLVAGQVYAAQSMEETYNRPNMQFEAGMIFSNVRAPSDVNSSSKSGFAAGVGLEFPVATVVSVTAEGLFAQRGFDLATAGNSNLSVKMNTIEVPVMLKAKIDQAVSPYLIAGPVASFNIGNTVEASGPAGTTALTFNPKTVDLAVAVGAGVDLGPLTASARYQWGVTDLDSNNPDFRDRGLYLLLGLRV